MGRQPGDDRKIYWRFPVARSSKGNTAKKTKSKTPITDAYAEILDSPFPEDPKGRTYREMIHDKLGERAKAGSKEAAKELDRWDRLFGPRPGRNA
jgi:hypothetical protein